MFRSRADADDVRGNPAQQRASVENAKEERRPVLRLGRVENAIDADVLGQDLKALNDLGWKLAALLHRPEIVHADGVAS